MKRQKKTKRASIKTMLLAPMLAINLLLVAIFIVAIGLSDVIFRVRESKVAGIQRAAVSRGEQVQQLLNDASLAATDMARGIRQSVNSMESGRENIYEALRSSPELASSALSVCVPHLTDTLKLNAGTGAFVVLDASALLEGGGFQGEQMAALYFIDEDMSTVSTSLADIALYFGPRAVARELEISLSDYWSEELPGERMKAKPTLFDGYETAKRETGLSMEQLGYWTDPMTREDGCEAIYYVVPLCDAAGRPYGIAGLELSSEYLRLRIGTADLEYADSGFYAITKRLEAESDPQWIAINGAAEMIRYLHGDQPIQRKALPEYGEDTWQLRLGGGEKMIASAYRLNIRDSDGAAGPGRWSLVAAADQEALFAEADALTRVFSAAILAALAIGAFLSIVGAGVFVRPILELTGSLLVMDPDEKITLEKTNIKEIDLLIRSIESISRDLAQTGQRTIQAIEMTEMPIGFLEINELRERVYLTDYLFELFDIEKEADSNFIPLRQWEELYAYLEENRDAASDNIFLLDLSNRPIRWLRVRMAEGAGKTFGIVIDVTDDILEKKRLEFERDTDMLTGLYGRSAFFLHSRRRVEEKPGLVGVMLFADLDNLKYVNDTYGHDFGDRYIRAAAAVFRLFSEVGGVVSRISGDEFAIFLYGLESKEKTSEIVADTYNNMNDASIALPDESEMKIRCSIGFAWYPDDSQSLEQLLKYADFAMYETKRSIKGSIREFSIESYLKNSFLVEKNEEFNQFIERNQVKYVFQPIIDIHTGKIYAYEALMRPQTPGFQTPYQIIRIARDQAKLYQIERMTIFNVYHWLEEHLEELGDRVIFLNSIPNQLLNEKDMEKLISRYGHLMHKVVVEVTEDERGDLGFISEKVKLIRQLGSQIAIDDYGAGYSNESTVVNLNPNFIKIDISLVKNIHQEEKKQTMVESIVGYAHQHGIKILAEGIEREEEMEFMIRLGADYLQGFYIAMPGDELPAAPEAVAEKIRALSETYRDRRKKREDEA